MGGLLTECGFSLDVTRVSLSSEGGLNHTWQGPFAPVGAPDGRDLEPEGVGHVEVEVVVIELVAIDDLPQTLEISAAPAGQHEQRVPPVVVLLGETGLGAVPVLRPPQGDGAVERVEGLGSLGEVAGLLWV